MFLEQTRPKYCKMEKVLISGPYFWAQGSPYRHLAIISSKNTIFVTSSLIIHDVIMLLVFFPFFPKVIHLSYLWSKFGEDWSSGCWENRVVQICTTPPPRWGFARSPQDRVKMTQRCQKTTPIFAKSPKIGVSQNDNFLPFRNFHEKVFI